MKIYGENREKKKKGCLFKGMYFSGYKNKEIGTRQD